MVDSISITQKHAQPPTWLESATEMVDQMTGVVRYFKTIREMKCKFDPAGVLQARGSLPKFLRGSNVKTMTRANVKRAIGALHEQVGFDPLFTSVYRLDLAATLTMPRPVSEYLGVLASASRYQRVQYEGETVMYRNASRSISFYDKGKQAHIDGNRLRIELKYKQSPRGYFDQPVMLLDLYDPAFFSRMVNAWQASYDLVRKVKRPVLEPAFTASQLRRQLEAIGLHAFGGESRVLAEIDAWQVDTKRKSNLRSTVRRIADLGSHPMDARLIAELDAAVQQEARSLLAY